MQVASGQVASSSAAAWEKDPYARVVPEMAQFWEAAAEGRLLVPHCAACGQYHWFPRAICPFCHSDRIELLPSAGRATIYSYSVARAFTPPHVLAYVKLEEGPVLMTNIINCDVNAVRIGQSVVVEFQQAAEGRHLPVFSYPK